LKSVKKGIKKKTGGERKGHEKSSPISTKGKRRGGLLFCSGKDTSDRGREESYLKKPRGEKRPKREAAIKNLTNAQNQRKYGL